MRLATVPLLLTVLVPCVACQSTADDGQERLESFREAWSSSDDPSLLSPNFVYTFADLPTAGHASKTPWAGSYWPTYKDSINDRWAGPATQSPATKYGLAFGIDGIEDAISAYSGIDSLAGTQCTSDAQCDPDQGSVCAKRAGETSGVCSETWFGICHAWAPAAILEDEPVEAVTYGGVEFKVNDLKALMSLAYGEQLEVKFLSLRCNEKGSDPGTADKAACKDTNPGSFHVAIANLVGLQGRSLVEDRTYDYEVWNQPIRSFEVTENKELSVQQALALLGGAQLVQTKEYATSVASGAWKQLGSVTVSPGQGLRVSMQGSGDGDLYVRWNAQPSVSAYDCRPYLNGSDEVCELSVPQGATTATIAVHGYTSASVDVKAEVREVADSYAAINPDAVAWRRIQTELHWIAESPQHVDGNLSATIDTYTHKDVYDYLLELDAAGEIIGGEWLGSSRENHPDFLWLPVKKHPGMVAGVIDYNNVRALFDLSTGGSPTTSLIDVEDTVNAGQWRHYGPIEVSGEATAALEISVGDADLYVRKGSAPTSSTYDCRPYLGGKSTETCSLNGAGTYYVSVNGWDATSDYQLKVVTN